MAAHGIQMIIINPLKKLNNYEHRFNTLTTLIFLITIRAMFFLMEAHVITSINAMIRFSNNFPSRNILEKI